MKRNHCLKKQAHNPKVNVVTRLCSSEKHAIGIDAEDFVHMDFDLKPFSNSQPNMISSTRFATLSTSLLVLSSTHLASQVLTDKYLILVQQLQLRLPLKSCT